MPQMKEHLDALSSLVLPKVIVFDLDYTLWPQFVCQSHGPPFKLSSTKRHVSDLKGCAIRFYDDVPSLLLWLSETNPEVTLAIASKSQQPQWAKTVLRMLPLQLHPNPETTVQQIVDEPLTQILPFLSKRVHLEKIHSCTEVPFSEMLFFDDEKVRL